MSNEMLAVSIPQVPDDIEIFEKIKTLLIAHDFVYIDMGWDYSDGSITYRFQRPEES